MFDNDLRYVAAERHMKITEISISVEVSLEGDPIIATNATLRVSVQSADGLDCADLIRDTSEISMAMNSLNRGISVVIRD